MPDACRMGVESLTSHGTHGMPALILCLLVMIASPAHAVVQTWTFAGEYTSTGDSTTIAIGDPFVLTVLFDPDQAGVPIQSGMQYHATATLTGIVGATDTSATIQISSSADLIAINLIEPDASLPQLEIAGYPGEFIDVDWIPLALYFDDVTSESLTDHLDLMLPTDPDDRVIVIQVLTLASPTGRVDTFSSQRAIVPALGPGGVAMLAAALAVAGAWRKPAADANS